MIDTAISYSAIVFGQYLLHVLVNILTSKVKLWFPEPKMMTSIFTSFIRGPSENLTLNQVC